MQNKIYLALSLLLVTVVHILLLNTMPQPPHRIPSPQKKLAPKVTQIKYATLKLPTPKSIPISDTKNIPTKIKPTTYSQRKPEKVKIKHLIKQKVAIRKKLKTKKTTTRKKYKSKKRKRKKRVSKGKVTKNIAPSHSSKKSKRRYISKVRAIIDRHKYQSRVAKRLKLSGRVKLRFSISSSGAIRNLHIVGGSPNSRLKKDAIQTMQNIGQFPAIPKSLSRKSITISFYIVYHSS